MNTDTNTMEAAAAGAPVGEPMAFDDKGICLNPERIEIPTPRGFQCVLLVALQPDGKWTYGALGAGNGKPLIRHQAVMLPTVQARVTREEAVEFAMVLALEAVDAGHPIGQAVERFRREMADVAVMDQLVGEKKEPLPPAFGGGNIGRVVEFPTREDAQAHIDEQRSRPGFADYHARIERRPKKGGTLFDVVYIRFGVPETSGADFDKNENGVFEAPNFREVEKMPGGFGCEIATAYAGGRWYGGHDFRARASGFGSPCSINGPAFLTEPEAIAHEIEAARHWFTSAPAMSDEKSPPEVFMALRAFAIKYAGEPAELPADTVNFAAGVAAAAEPELITHYWNAAGECAQPEYVSVPDMPKGSRLEIELGLAEDGLWRFGYVWDNGKKGHGQRAKLEDRGFAARADALLAGLKATALFFDKNKKADAAIEAFYIALKSSSPANTPAEVAPAPAAAPERMVYKTEFAEIPINKIQRNPLNHRKHFDPIELRELAESMLLEGLHQPIGVRKLLDGEQPDGELGLVDAGAAEYELIYGERRWRAGSDRATAERLGVEPLSKLQAKIYHGLRRDQCHAIALIENLQRQGINAMEEANGFAELMAAEHLTQEAAAARVGKERSTVANVLGLLTLPEKTQGWIGEGVLTKAHGIALKRFVPDLKKGEDKDFPKWEMVINIMAEEAVERKAPAGSLEKGVPSVHKLTQAGLALRIHRFGMGSYDIKLPAAFRKHPAYWGLDDGDWICMNPAHWTAYVAEQEKLAKDKEAAEKAKREAEAAAAAKKGRKQITLSELDRTQYKRFDGASDVERAALSLVPDAGRATAKEGGRNVAIVTDVQMAERLTAAMMRGIKKNRREAAELLREKVIKKIGSVKKVGPRELAWLVFLIADNSGRCVHLRLQKEAAKAAGVKLPKGAEYTPDTGEDEDQLRSAHRMAALSKCEGPDLVRVLMTERLDKALEELIEIGPDSTGAQFVRWWLDSDTLWLLEETDEGRAELVDQVKNAPWYAKAVAGEPAGEDEK